MKFAAALLLPLCAGAVRLHLREATADATVCGKGFENLVDGSRQYFEHAKAALWGHPAATDTFEPEEKCWFAAMTTSKCGNLPSLANSRKKELSAKCQDEKVTAVQMWKYLSPDELRWLKKEYPMDWVQTASEPTVTEPPTSHHRQVMKTAFDLETKEFLCLTMFTIDDECVKWPHIRLQS
mmetsp:Transcript_41592/g.109799  ORF Transcript_41592/g.109799 Transcript_41592/m.109799 type:complete len:181 (-) Transcript_41592:39-581(-)